MRVLLVGAGGVGSAAVRMAARRDFFEHWVGADYDHARAQAAVGMSGGGRFVAATVDASSATAVADLCREHGTTRVLNAVDPRFVMPIFDGAFAAGAHYLDMAMSLSRPDPREPHSRCGVKLGDEQFAAAEAWQRADRLALVGIGVEPGLARTAHIGLDGAAADAVVRDDRDRGPRPGRLPDRGVRDRDR